MTWLGAWLLAKRSGQQVQDRCAQANTVTTHYEELWLYRDGKLVKVRWR